MPSAVELQWTRQRGSPASLSGVAPPVTKGAVLVWTA
eukprot:CAMPEP_0181542006 /NCGR_PEP_ID=MMETSP1110-20121109/77691_1 /TAXON_ID=174948 /ORGANISM="Symbiodinium sp., Strain CCMP421" /LENGTH=36 /DNA_ID= /DNA_START= /DNA_END= /DNA_ORIENTATION=